MSKTHPTTRRLAFVLACLCFAIGTGLFAAEGQAAVSGTVVGPEGQPLEGLEVALFAGTDIRHEAAVAGARTDAEGAFRLEAEPDENAVLQISGEQGAGRVRLQPDADEPLRIAYPVRKQVVLLHDNDLHFDFNQREEFTAAVQEVRERYDDVYLFNAGDTFVRHAHRWIDEDGNLRDIVWYAERAMRMIALKNEIGYDAMVMGNHEMDTRGPYTGAALGAAQFPVLAADYEGETDLLPPLPPYAIFTTSTGRTLAVLGLATGRTPEGMRRINRNEAVEKYLHLREEHDIFIALTHIGLRSDRALAERFPAFDVIIGGHSHSLLPEGERVGDVLVVQARGSGHVTSRNRPKYLGKAVLTLENGRIVDKKASVMTFDPPPPPPPPEEEEAEVPEEEAVEAVAE